MCCQYLAYSCLYVSREAQSCQNSETERSSPSCCSYHGLICVTGGSPLALRASLISRAPVAPRILNCSHISDLVYQATYKDNPPMSPLLCVEEVVSIQSPVHSQCMAYQGSLQSNLVSTIRKCFLDLLQCYPNGRMRIDIAIRSHQSKD